MDSHDHVGFENFASQHLSNVKSLVFISAADYKARKFLRYVCDTFHAIVLVHCKVWANFDLFSGVTLK